MELTERKKKILRAIVDCYIQTAEPVGSKAIAAMPGMDVSSATVRNEMADLTELGYLEQPHTSSGRIPAEYIVATTEPALTPAMISGFSPTPSRALIAPRCAKPLAPPPLRARPIRNLGRGVREILNPNICENEVK